MTALSPEPLIIKQLSHADYAQTHEAMSARTLERIEQAKSGIKTADELWIVEHNDVYTLGQAGKESHILRRTDTPIIKTDRGGQVTWHGKGQLVLYWLFDLKTLGWSVRELVSHAEQAIEDVVNVYLQSASTDQLRYYAKARKDAPGVYIYSQSIPAHNAPHSQAENFNSVVNDTELNSDKANNDPVDAADIMMGKLASLGFKIKHGMSYHGIAVNLSCDLRAFLAINPCGYAGMTMLRLCDFVNMMGLMDNQITLMDSPFTHDLVANISLRHQGQIALRS